MSREKVESLIRLALDPAASEAESRTAALAAVKLIARDSLLEDEPPPAPARREPPWSPRPEWTHAQPAEPAGPPTLITFSDGEYLHDVWSHAKDRRRLPDNCYAICGALFHPIARGRARGLPMCEHCERSHAR